MVLRTWRRSLRTARWTAGAGAGVFSQPVPGADGAGVAGGALVARSGAWVRFNVDLPCA